MNTVDYLPQSSGVSALVRRIVWRLDAALAFNNHPILSTSERAGLFDLAEASRILDRIAILPGMAQPEESARSRLLDLYDVFDPVAHNLEATQPVSLTTESPPCKDFADVRVISATDGAALHNITEDLKAGRRIVIIGGGGGGGSWRDSSPAIGGNGGGVR